MSFIKKFFTRSAYYADTVYDLFLFQFKKTLRLFDPCIIYPYLGYGSDKTIYLKGRVLEKIKITGVTVNDTAWRNIANMFRRMETDEVSGAVIKAYHNDQEFTFKTDREGFFEIQIPFAADGTNWTNIELEILESPVPFTPGVRIKASVMVPALQTEFGIISDIDDTILFTQATSVIRMLKNTFLLNAFTRLPFEGAADFYKKLQAGFSGKNFNPVFYLSSSPWNIYDMLIQFLKNNHFPEGPLILKDYGIEKDKFFSNGHMGHKYVQIANLMNFYPRMNFILIGDSGQEDAKIYMEVIKNFPGRVKAAYIRDVNIPQRTEVVKKIIDSKESEVDMILFENSKEAFEHAIKKGFIKA